MIAVHQVHHAEVSEEHQNRPHAYRHHRGKAAGAAIVHYVWLVKADLLAPLAYAGVLIVLALLRLRHARRAAAPSALRTRSQPTTR